MIRRLAYFLHHHSRGRPCRYAVVTAGQRVAWHGNLHGQRAGFLDRINRWSSEARARYGIELLYRGDNDTLCRRPETTADGVNLHADLVYRPTRRLSQEDWGRFLTWSRQRLGGVHWRDCGVLRNPEAVVRYVLKLSWGKNGLTPDDRADGLIGIDEMEADELAWYYRETLHATRVKSLRGFHDFCKTLDDNKEEIRWVPGRDGARELRRVQRPRLNRRPVGRARDGQPGRLENIVLGRTAPHPRFSDICEPCSIVMSFTPNPTTALGRSGIGMIMARAEQAARWAGRNQQAPLKVHSMTSVGPTSSSLSSACHPSMNDGDHNPQPSAPSQPANHAEGGRQIVVSQEVEQPYRPTPADYDQLAAFYRELRPGISDAHLRMAVLSCGDYHAGPIGPAIEKMRAKLIRKTAPVPAPEPAQVIAMPVRRTRWLTEADYAEMSRYAIPANAFIVHTAQAA
jgi:hypothetical protein